MIRTPGITVRPTTVVLQTAGLQYASEKAVVERALRSRPGVLVVEANPVAQTATVSYDPSVTSVADLRRWVEECGYHYAGQSVPNHVCFPMEEPGLPARELVENRRRTASAAALLVGGRGGRPLQLITRLGEETGDRLLPVLHGGHPRSQHRELLVGRHAASPDRV